MENTEVKPNTSAAAEEITLYNTFESLGINTDGKDGFFNCKSVPIGDILDTDLLLLDFHLNVKTGYGDGRSILKVKNLSNGSVVKTFTSATKIHEALEQIEDKSKALPIKTQIITIEPKKGTKSYMFI